MEGVHRVYNTSLNYTKKRYVPSTWDSVPYILLYTVVVFYITEFLMRGRITRWLYLGTIAMVIAWMYEGSVTGEDL